MSRYDELSAAFAVWHEEAVSVQRAWQQFPIVLANNLRTYLGAPETFEDSVLEENRRSHRYVSAATATWNNNTQSFDLKISENIIAFFDIEAHQKDGRFYFAVAVYLERGRKTFPKQPFWFLLSLGWEDRNHFSLRIQRTEEVYIITNKDLDQTLEPVCKAIQQLLMEDLSISPFATRTQTKGLPASS